MKRMIGATIALTLLGSSAAFAQVGENRSGQQLIEVQNRNSSQDRGQNTYTTQQNRNDYRTTGNNDVQNRNNSEERGQDNFGQDQARNDHQANGNNEVRDNPHWSRGDRLSAEYRSNQYVVSNWKTNHLRQPPRGYHWVRANNQYVLAAVATGIIADIIMNNQRAR